MNANEIVWLIVGTAAGYLLGTLATVWLLKYRVREIKMHPMQVHMTAPPPTLTPRTVPPSAPENDDLGWTLSTLSGETINIDGAGAVTTSSTANDALLVDWDAAVREELVEPPKRRHGAAPKATADEVCVYCGGHYKRVSQHIRLSHPTRHQPEKRKLTGTVKRKQATGVNPESATFGHDHG